MTKEQFNALVALGFTGDQILAIAGTGKKQEEKPTVKTEEVKPEVKPTETDVKTEDNETVKMLKEMLGLMKGNNINSLSMHPQDEKTGADILADIIDPE